MKNRNVKECALESKDGSDFLCYQVELNYYFLVGPILPVFYKVGRVRLLVLGSTFPLIIIGRVIIDTDVRITHLWLPVYSLFMPPRLGRH
jgi:hypothetical protein